MKSRKHVRTVLFIAGMLAVGTTMGAALLIERHGGGSSGLGKQDHSSAAARPAQAPVANSAVYSSTPDAEEQPVALGSTHWSPPGLVAWPQGGTAGAQTYGWDSSYTLPDFVGYSGRGMADASQRSSLPTIVPPGADYTSAFRVSYNRSTDEAPAAGSLFNAVPTSLSPAPAPARAASVVALAPPVPEPAEWAMLLTGLLVVSAVARHRNRRASAAST